MSTSPLPLSTWAQNIAPSPTLAIDAKAKALKAAGEDVCSFAAGEPDFDTPGIDELRAALADKYATSYGLKIAPAQVVVSPGGKFSCYLAILAVCSPGD